MHAGKLKFLLAPFSVLYGMVVGLRNNFFDWGILPSEQFPVPVICVGNLAVGGTGKTPHTEFIVRLLREKYRIAVLSRGYKRKTKGFVLATPTSTSYEIGDEPYQIYSKYPDILVAVDADRRNGIRRLLALKEPPQVILLDDAFQHRYVTPSLSIVLTEYDRPFYTDSLLPYGRLRESKYGVQRSDVVVVTKCCRDIKPIEYRIMEKNMCLTAHQVVFFTLVMYGEMKAVFPKEADPWSLLDIRKDDSVLLIAGIVSPDGFIREMKKYTQHVIPMVYPDHHFFNEQDIAKIEQTFQNIQSLGKVIVMTEKDAARFKGIRDLIPESIRRVMYALPITVDFCTRTKDEFEDIINKHITTFQREKGINQNNE